MVVRRFGTGDELVWIHGLGESSVGFDAVAQHSALAGYTHVLPDLPGYGRSPWPDATSGLSELADQLVAWLGGRTPVLIGHSMGGVLATLVAERTSVRAVVDLDGNLSAGDCTFSRLAAAYDAADFVTRGMATLRDAIYLRGIEERPLRGYHAAMGLASPAVFHRHAVELVALSEPEDLAPRLAALACPHLFIAGAPGGTCAYSRALLDQHHVNTIAIEPAGHWVHLDRPDHVVAALAGFLDHHRRATAPDR